MRPCSGILSDSGFDTVKVASLMKEMLTLYPLHLCTRHGGRNGDLAKDAFTTILQIYFLCNLDASTDIMSH
jgi:hypothetical protein